MPLSHYATDITGMLWLNGQQQLHKVCRENVKSSFLTFLFLQKNLVRTMFGVLLCHRLIKANATKGSDMKWWSNQERTVKVDEFYSGASHTITTFWSWRFILLSWTESNTNGGYSPLVHMMRDALWPISVDRNISHKKLSPLFVFGKFCGSKNCTLLCTPCDSDDGN